MEGNGQGKGRAGTEAGSLELVMLRCTVSPEYIQKCARALYRSHLYLLGPPEI